MIGTADCKQCGGRTCWLQEWQSVFSEQCLRLSIDWIESIACGIEPLEQLVEMLLWHAVSHGIKTIDKGHGIFGSVGHVVNDSANVNQHN